MCSEIGTNPKLLSINDQSNRLSETSTFNDSTSTAGGWQGGDYQVLLEGEGIVSCDSSVGAWSEDGHLDHINAKKKNSKRGLSRNKRSSSIVHGTLVMQKNDQYKEHLAIPTSFLQLPSTANSDAFSASFSSPLHKFPSTPARSHAGQLVTQPQSPNTPRSFLPPPPSQTQHAHNSLIPQMSQERMDASPLDVVSIVASGWAIESEEYSDDYNTEAASALIDSLLQGVQEGFLTSAVVDSTSRMTEADDEENSSQVGWETDDCEITPRVRQVWQEVDTSYSSSRSISNRRSRIVAEQSKFSQSTDTSSYIPAVSVRRQSFIRIPSAIFPHTPAQAKADRRKSSQSITSISSSVTERSRHSRYSTISSSSLLSEREKSIKRRSIHLASTPRPMSRKSKYYSRPAQPGAMPFIKQQHLKGARGKFWSPMNSLYIGKDEEVPSIEEIMAGKSSRYSRRSGQAWIRPRTFEVKDQYRVTIYPPQIDDSHCRKVFQGTDPDKTPTQALFKVVSVADQPRSASRASRTSSLSCRLPPGPPPTRMLPPVPFLDNPPRQTRRLSKRTSKGVRLSQATAISTATSGSCSQCQQSDSSSCSCSQSFADVGSSYRASTYSRSYSEGQSATCSENQTEDYTESQSCSCTDASTCSCTTTRSSIVESQVESMLTPRQSYFGYRERTSLDKASQILGLPRSAPLHTPSEQPTAASIYANQPHSAPYYSSENPPVLEPLPRFSPFRLSFDHIFGKRKSKRWSRYSISNAFSRSSRCSTCTDGSELAYVQSRSERVESTSDGTLIVSSSPSYASGLRSSSSSSPSNSPMSELDSDIGSEQDSDMPLTPTRSEYQSSFGLSESPGYRMSFIVSPMPQSAKRHSQMDELLMFSPQNNYDDKDTDESRFSALRPISHFTSTTASGMTTTSSSLTVSVNGTSRVPRSILKTSSRYREDSQGAEVNHRRPTVSMAVDTIFKSGSTTFAGKTMSTSSSSSSLSSSASSTRSPFSSATPQRATLATSTMTKHDLEGRIQREENRRKRNESRLYALEKLEGKTKKSSLFFSLLSNASSTANGVKSDVSEWQEQEEDLASPLPQTPLTPAKLDLLELQRQVENRQRITQFQNNKAVSFTDVIGFDLGTYPKFQSRDSASVTSEQQDALLKMQLKKLSTAIEARQYAKDKCIDK